MTVKVSLSEEARNRLLELCAAERKSQPLAILLWQEPTAELRRAASGASILERVSGVGSIQVVPGGGVPASSIVYIQGVPFLRDTLPDSDTFSLQVGFASGAFVVARHGS